MYALRIPKSNTELTISEKKDVLNSFSDYILENWNYFTTITKVTPNEIEVCLKIDERLYSGASIV